MKVYFFVAEYTRALDKRSSGKTERDWVGVVSTVVTVVCRPMTKKGDQF